LSKLTGLDAVFVIAGLVSIVAGVQIWRMSAVEYEFTGDEIIEKRKGRIRNRLFISNILEASVIVNQSKIQNLILKTSNSGINIQIQIVPSLAEVIQKETANMIYTIPTKIERRLASFRDGVRWAIVAFVFLLWIFILVKFFKGKL
jgi:hypothetical protein